MQGYEGLSEEEQQYLRDLLSGKIKLDVIAHHPKVDPNSPLPIPHSPELQRIWEELMRGNNQLPQEEQQ